MSSDIVLETVEGSDVDDERPALKAALNRLHKDQRKTLQEFLVEGFDARQDLLEWLHDLQLITLGHVGEEVFVNLGTKPILLVCCITSDERYRYRPTTDIDLETAEDERRTIAATHLRPACRRALRELREKAIEHVDDSADGEVPDPRKSPHTAMRPVLDEYHGRQEDVLEAFLDGFGDRPAIDRWLHDLDLATYGEIEAVVDGGLDQRIATKPVLERALLRDDPKYESARERLAATYLLPACNRAIRELALSADESFHQVTEDRQPTQL